MAQSQVRNVLSPITTHIVVGRPANRAALTIALAVVPVAFAAVVLPARWSLYVPSEDLHFGHAERRGTSARNHVDESASQRLPARDVYRPGTSHVFNAGLVFCCVPGISNVDRQKLVASRALDQAVRVCRIDVDARDAAQGYQISAPRRGIEHIGKESVNHVWLRRGTHGRTLPAAGPHQVSEGHVDRDGQFRLAI
jgi:hypothetical protein